MVLAAFAALMPARSAAIFRFLTSQLAFAQAPLTALVRSAGEAIHDTPDDQALAEQLALMQADIEWFERQVGHLDLRLREQQQQIETLTRMRDTVGSQGRIIIGRVLGLSPNSREETLLVSLVGLDGVQVGQWVAAGDELDPNVKDYAQRLAGECLIGRVKAIDGWVATVQLTSDPKYRTQVQLAIPQDDARWKLLVDQPEALFGIGGGQMRIEGSQTDYYAKGAVLVLAPASRLLPSPMTLGRITGSRRRDETQMHFDLKVQPWRRAADLRYVYIIAP
jgi:cell shape-determining protein MreC